MAVSGDDELEYIDLGASGSANFYKVELFDE
jgi:hypothetical protein